MPPDPHNPVPPDDAAGKIEAFLPQSLQTWWMHLLIAAVLLVLGGLAVRYAAPSEPTPPPVINLNVPPLPGPLVAGATATDPQVVDGVRQGPARRLLASLIRHRVERQLMTSGFKAIGGNPKPLSEAEARKLLDRLDDEQLLEGAKAVGGLGDGKILDALGRLLDWLEAHQDQIARIVKWVMSLLALFADEQPAGVGVLPLDNGGVMVCVWFETGRVVCGVFA